ncbi:MULTISPECIES: 4-demethylwyosine synthase TYW1 [Methanothrix]|uniref:S-adenosyl-L-methionine-dependent tRNA 4-demethylwyosine synthase n=1 Tax=Methanothrix thermoacetophila (strain DSM 6194 / JCM 14653 / NBRC 101360 / PT) TaxID=349307 RepID=A0B677_METTP|nr:MULTISPECIES: 4-demethylwyosine synthase TYW1 [Methanothrix]ABK14201.1 Wyosine base formation [Methanothrix thermoacetophila PT]
MDPAALERQGYHLVGEGAVKPCLWLKRSLRGREQCYKHHFYGIESHRCVQMTPVLHCNHLCLHCWRPVDDSFPLPERWTEPEDLLDLVLREQRRILSGYWGSDVVDRARLQDASTPKHVAISLMGEPTFYPHLRGLIKAINERGMTSFLVTNGTNPDVLKDVDPTQLYISINAPDEDTYRRVSGGRDWNRILESLAMMRDLRCRTVVRITLIRGVNMFNPDAYARLLDAEPDFVEVKAYMHLGRSRYRLSRDAMPSHEEVVSFASALAESMGYTLEDQVSLSRVALLTRGNVQRKLDKL